MTSTTTKSAFVTVGSTKFDALIQKVLQEDLLDTFRVAGFTHLVVQCGESVLDPLWVLTGSELVKDANGLRVEIWKFRPSIDEEMAAADLIISHAGSGTILSALRMNKHLIVVPNDTLLDNHQMELAEALHERGHLVAATVQTMNEAISKGATGALEPFPAIDGTPFAEIMDEEMGFLS